MYIDCVYIYMYCNRMNSETKGVLCGVDVEHICHIVRQHVDGITSVPFLVSTLHVLSVCRGCLPYHQWNHLNNYNVYIIHLAIRAHHSI